MRMFVLSLCCLCLLSGAVEGRKPVASLFQVGASCKAQSQKDLAFVRRFCAGLGATMIEPPTTKEKAQPAIPEHWQLRWGWTVGKVLWSMDKHKLPIRQYCFSKIANAYLKHKRLLTKRILKRQLHWEAIYYFRQDGDMGLRQILFSSPSFLTHQEAAGLLAGMVRKYGKATTKKRTKSYQAYKWKAKGTTIKLGISLRGPKKASVHINFYSSRN